jgi:hypothetical protein
VSGKTITVFVTKYALTQGILRKRVEDCHDGMVSTVGDRYVAYFHGEGREWHRTFDSASERAERMRTEKLASVAKQIAKLKALKFNACKDDSK